MQTGKYKNSPTFKDYYNIGKNVSVHELEHIIKDTEKIQEHHDTVC